jgi:hypothetical protein
VTGLLRTESGTVVDSALVRIEAAHPTVAVCDFRWGVESLPWGSSGQLIVGGTLDMHVFSPYGPGRRCLRVVAEREGTVTLLGRVDGVEVRFRWDRELPDTLRVLLVMRGS